jgi:hypothetical protein
MGRDNDLLGRVKIRQTSAEKRIDLQLRRKGVDFVKFQKETCFPLDFIESAFEPSQTKRSTWRKRKKEASGVYKKGHVSFDQQKANTFNSIEERLWKEFLLIKKGSGLRKYLDHLDRFHSAIPGSGKTSLVIRYIAENFFMKTLRGQTSECISNQKVTKPGQDFAKI